MPESDTESGRVVQRPPRLPIMRWLPVYRSEWLGQDVIAGVTLAAFAIPVSLAYATVAGLEPHHGVYCYPLGCLARIIHGMAKYRIKE